MVNLLNRFRRDKKGGTTAMAMDLLSRFHNDRGGIELIEFIIGGTLMVAIMMLIMVAIWNTTNARADATNSIITTNVPTAAQP